MNIFGPRWGDDSNQDNFVCQHNDTHEPTNN